MQRKDQIILKKVIDEIDIGSQMLEGLSLETFLENEILKRAVSMTIINIGELVKNISDELRNERKDIPWKAIAGMRDLTAHKYQTLRMEDVYRTAKQDFPMLKTQLQGVLDSGKER